MGFTDLISKIPIGKPMPPSIYDRDFVMATIGKFSSIINPSVIQLLDKLKSHSSLIEQNSENCNDLTLSNMIV